MKRLICAFLVFGVACSVAGCQKSGLPQPDFPLTEDVILAAQEQTGLLGVISESETKSYGDGRMSYTLRHMVEGDTENMMATATLISSALFDGERFLSMIFASGVPDKPDFAWEDWKQQVEFATLLYGGFSDAEEVYRVFSVMEVSVASMEQNSGGIPGTGTCSWDAQLPGAYCIVRYSLYGERAPSSSDEETEIKSWSRHLNVNFYESEARYQEIYQKQQEIQKKQRERIAAIKDARLKDLKETAPWLTD